MSLWIETHCDLIRHPKIGSLVVELGLKSRYCHSEQMAVGMMVSLWCWAIQSALDGDLSNCPNQLIAMVCGWRGDANQFVDALIKCHWLDPNRHIHNWDLYTNLLWIKEEDRKAKNRERVRRHRERQRQNGNASASRAGNGDMPEGNVTGRYSNALTGPDPTIPDYTYYDGDGVSLGSIQQYLEDRGIDPMSIHGMTPECYSSIARYVDEVLLTFAARKATPYDYSVATAHIVVNEKDENGTWVCSVDTDKRELLSYAIEESARVGQGGNWKYIEGVLSRLHTRGISTLADAEHYDMGRDDVKP